MVDTLVSKASAEKRVGSSPTFGTYDYFIVGICIFLLFLHE